MTGTETPDVQANILHLWRKLEASKRTIACSPAYATRVRAAVEAAGAGHTIQVIASRIVPDGQAYVFAGQTIEPGPLPAAHRPERGPSKDLPEWLGDSLAGWWIDEVFGDPRGASATPPADPSTPNVRHLLAPAAGILTELHRQRARPATPRCYTCHPIPDALPARPR
ncbi:hypothetical protein [Sphaerisporangium aureirubrum]|uniref:Uncharacterized protein n=1 Tax=Sphaerisporangium aureirubrum TaxID=1544736 RepID=A0ABW1NC88_9ACTN